MNKSIERRLDRLATRLLPDGPSKCWQILTRSPEGRGRSSRGDQAKTDEIPPFCDPPAAGWIGDKIL